MTKETRLTLINMPFGALRLPSIGLTQLESVVRTAFNGAVSVDIRYLNHDFGRFMGGELYRFFADSMDSHNSGLGDWFFRQLAFPKLADNAEKYLRRYFPRSDASSKKLKDSILAKRQDLDAFLDELVAKHDLDSADIAGFTSMFAQNMASFALARKLKERRPQIVTLMGGANCEAPMGQEIARNVHQIDFVFSGSALRSFPAFLRRHLDRDLEGRNRLAGVFSRYNSAPERAESLRIYGEELDIDTKVDLDYAGFLDSLESVDPDHPIEPALLFETSRGCWWGQRAHCTFCGLNGSNMYYRGMRPERALEQFESLFKYAPRVKVFECVDNIMPKDYPKTVFARLKTPPGTRIFYEVKSDLTEAEVGILSNANVTLIQPGIESLATSTLKLMKKGSTAFQNLVFLKNCTTHAILPAWNILVGFPGEEADVYRKYLDDIPSLFHLPPPTGVYPVRFDRYSPYFVEASDYGLDLHPLDYYELCYPFPKEVLENLAYYFMDRNYRARYFVTMLEWIEPVRKKVEEWRRTWTSDGRSLPPRLFFRENGSGAVVHDSRQEEAVERQLGEMETEVLKSLAKPRLLDTLASQLPGVTRAEVQRTLDSLGESRLIFREGDRFMSLVLAGEPRRLDDMRKLYRSVL